MKFLANAPMMQFLMHPFHRNDLTGVNTLYVELYGGPALTPAEIAHSQSNAVNLSNGFLNASSMHTLFRTTRPLLAYGPDPVGFSSFIQKSHYGNTDSKALLCSQRSQQLSFVAAGTATMAYVVLHNGSWSTGARVGFILTAGGLGSGAELELENPVIANGGRYRMNDIIINIAGLLGE